MSQYDLMFDSNGNRYPEALKPHVTIGNFNEPMVLYNGPMEVSQSGIRLSLHGEICLEFLPSPGIRFVIPTVPPRSGLDLGPVTLLLNDGTELVDCYLTKLNPIGSFLGRETSVAGFINGPVHRKSCSLAKNVRFLLPNFQYILGNHILFPSNTLSRSRIKLQGPGWIITLDCLENHQEIFSFLKSQSGLRFTHIGMIEKEDQQPFQIDELENILEALSIYLSFASGRWTGPFLPKGFDESGNQVWDIWRVSRTTPYFERDSWIACCHQESLEGPFSGFLKLWLDPNWEEVIRISINWYIEANSSSGPVEGGIVLTQTGFELLSSAVLLENNNWISSIGYDKLPASDCFRLLFRWAGIPTEIPKELIELTKQAKGENWFDSPHAMTELRNSIIHPVKKNRVKLAKSPLHTRAEARKLGLWYLELVLLKLFEYQGNYENRLKDGVAGEGEPVPWAASKK